MVVFYTLANYRSPFVMTGNIFPKIIRHLTARAGKLIKRIRHSRRNRPICEKAPHGGGAFPGGMYSCLLLVTR